MRLTDVDNLIELIDKEYPTVDRQDMKMMIAKAPIVYDVEKVMKELISISNEFTTESWAKLKSIIERGGIE